MIPSPLLLEYSYSAPGFGSVKPPENFNPGKPVAHETPEPEASEPSHGSPPSLATPGPMSRIPGSIGTPPPAWPSESGTGYPCSLGSVASQYQPSSVGSNTLFSPSGAG